MTFRHSGLAGRIAKLERAMKMRHTPEDDILLIIANWPGLESGEASYDLPRGWKPLNDIEASWDIWWPPSDLGGYVNAVGEYVEYQSLHSPRRMFYRQVGESGEDFCRRLRREAVAVGAIAVCVASEAALPLKICPEIEL